MVVKLVAGCVQVTRHGRQPVAQRVDHDYTNVARHDSLAHYVHQAVPGGTYDGMEMIVTLVGG